MSSLPPIKVGTTNVTSAPAPTVPVLVTATAKNAKITDRTGRNGTAGDTSQQLPAATTIATSSRVNVHKDAASYRAEREMNLQSFRELMRIFQNASKSEEGGLTMEEFKKAFGIVLGHNLTEEQMGLLFMKIDANTDGSIDWDEFSTYMLLRAEGQNNMLEAEETVLFAQNGGAGGQIIPTPHRDMVKRVLFLDGLRKWVSCSRDGTLCIWSDRLKLQKTFRSLRKTNELEAKTGANASVKASATSRWIHDFGYLGNVNKIVTASDDHQITIYDMTTMYPEIRLDTEDSVPLCLDFYYDADNADNDECMLLYGTDSGTVHIFNIRTSALFNNTSGKKEHTRHISMDTIPRGANMTTFPQYGTLTKRKAHNDWCVKVAFFVDLHMVISCSPDPRASLFVATQVTKKKWACFSVPVHKGVSAFAYCKFPVTLITGGTDRQLRLWNPYRMHHPMAALKGHNAPIVDIAINNFSGQIISLSSDKVIKVWDIRKQQCVQTLCDNFPHHPEDALSCLTFCPNTNSLVAASSLLVTYKLRERNVRVSIPVSHEMPLRAALYNASFKQVVSGCDGSVINVWDVVNGQKSFRFADVHGKAEITAMSFDAGSRRLITGGRDGLIRMWNFNNGQCLHEMIKGDDTEVSGICYIDLKGSQFVVASGWNRRITMFQDSLESFKLYPIQRWPDPEIIGNAANPSPPFPSTEPPQWEEITAPPPSSWHSDDILAMDFCPPNMLITSSYDGEILVCNLVSGHVLHRLCPRDFGDDSIGLNDVTSRSIDKVIVLSERIDLLKEAALLITSGADGYIRWWNLDEGYLMHMHGTPPRFSPSESKGVYAMATNARNTMLVTGDAVGFVTILDIKEHCISQNIRPSSPPPPVIAVFRAHVATIMSVDIVEGYDMVISASTDGTARMFTFKGEYVGTFGQDEPWDIGDPSTFEHPLKPLDVALHEVEESQDPDAIEE
ncbi:WD40-repeat-containing domain protein, partial [Cladochytrium replicatum]